MDTGTITTNSSATREVKLFNINCNSYDFQNCCVYVEKTNDQNISRLHPMVVADILHQKLKINNIKQIKSIGRNRVKVILKSILDANNLVNNSHLKEDNLKAYIPNHLLEIKGLIRDVDTKYNIDYLKKYMSSSSPIIDF
uniref:Uncharacterized protein LOC114346508 isoform X1 n=1 Tax=Diabrotica virgifera virgifera TaxID=50390 RepID=A0A6P7HB25_DIAVI